MGSARLVGHRLLALFLITFALGMFGMGLMVILFGSGFIGLWMWLAGVVSFVAGIQFLRTKY